MISVTKLSGEKFILNAELIRSVESLPDTYITLTTSERFIVLESMEEVVKRTMAYSRAVKTFPSGIERTL